MSEPNSPRADTSHATAGGAQPANIAADNDPRIVQMLSTEHWSVLSARSLAYNEAFARGGMFLSFLSMSAVALGLLVQGTGFDRDFLVIVAIVLTFDLLIGTTTYFRIGGAGADDLTALHGMSRIRHAYTEIAPALRPYFTAPVNDDIPSLMKAYGTAWGNSWVGELTYLLSTTAGMIGLIVCALGGVLAGVLTALLGGLTAGLSALVGVVGAVLLFAGLTMMTFRVVSAKQSELQAMFPAHDEAG